MKSRTLISFCQRPGSKPSQAVSRAPLAAFALPPFTIFTAFAGGALFAAFGVVGDLAAFAAFAALAFALAAFGLAAITIPSLCALGLREPEHGCGVPRDHELLVGRDHPRRHAAARRADSRAALRVRAAVELHAEPRGRGAAPLADLGRALADAGREHECVDAAEHGRERADLFRRFVHEVVDREARGRLLACLKLAHVVAHAGDAEQARLLVQHRLDVLRGHLERL